MENSSGKNLTAEEIAARKIDKTKDDNSKNKGSSEVDIRRHDSGKDHGRTTDTLGVGHEPGTIPGSGI